MWTGDVLRLGVEQLPAIGRRLFLVPLFLSGVCASPDNTAALQRATIA
jgi:hypothetical protein